MQPLVEEIDSSQGQQTVTWIYRNTTESKYIAQQGWKVIRLLIFELNPLPRYHINTTIIFFKSDYYLLLLSAVFSDTDVDWMASISSSVKLRSIKFARNRHGE